MKFDHPLQQMPTRKGGLRPGRRADVPRHRVGRLGRFSVDRVVVLPPRW
jgi:hypothetical protein